MASCRGVRCVLGSLWFTSARKAKKMLTRCALPAFAASQVASQVQVKGSATKQEIRPPYFGPPSRLASREQGSPCGGGPSCRHLASPGFGSFGSFRQSRVGWRMGIAPCAEWFRSKHVSTIAATVSNTSTHPYKPDQRLPTSWTGAQQPSLLSPESQKSEAFDLDTPDSTRRKKASRSCSSESALAPRFSSQTRRSG